MTSALTIAKRNMTERLKREVAAHNLYKRGNKYRAVKTTVDGRKFDSKAEAKRGAELELLQRAGAISNLKYQVRYKFHHNGTDLGSYIADFVYDDARGVVVEDVKSEMTAKLPMFKMKERMMRAFHGIVIKVVIR
jgi:Protein of unknown function (DUF1064)